MARLPTDQSPGLPGRPQRIMEHWRLFEAIADHSAALIWSITLDGRFTFANGETEVFFGSSSAGIIGKSIYDFLPPELASQHLDHDQKTLAHGKPLQFEEEFLKNGSRCTYLSVKFPLPDDTGEIVEIGCISMETTAKKELEEARRFRFLIDSIPHMVWTAHPDGSGEYYNRRMLEYLGKTMKEMQGWAWVDLVHPEDRQAAVEASRQAIRAKSEYFVEIRIRNGRTGEYRWFRDHALPHLDEQDRILRWYGTCTDIHDHKLAEKALRESRSQLQTILDSAPVGIIVTDAGGSFIFSNRLADEMLGGQATGDAYGPTGGYTIHRPDGSPFLSEELPLSCALRGKTSENVELLVRFKEGKGKVILAFARPIVAASGEISGAVASLQDITTRKEAEVELKKRSDQLEEAQKIAKVGSWEWDIANDRITWSRQLYRIFEVEPEEFDATYQAFLDFVHPVDREAAANLISQAVHRNRPYADDHRIITAEGREKLLHSRGAVILDQEGRPALMRGSCQDVTEQRRKETELMKIGKLESLGILAGGIAHDFNNILTAIQGNIELAKMILPPGSSAADRLAIAGRACERAKGLSRQLLTFAKGGAPIKNVHPLQPLIQESVELALRGSNVKGSYSFPAGLWDAEVDESQFSQVVNNLVINADQSMPEGGTLTIAASNVFLHQGNTLGLAAGKYIRIDFKDQGIGIQRKYFDKIFDPYFTTKEKGSGLGLAVCYSIMKKHGGAITVDSVLGEGTTFSLFIPAASSREQAPATRAGDESIQGSGRILIMDDDETVSQTAADMLQSLGYRVDTVKDGAEAVHVYKEARQKGDAFKAVITDLTVPGGMGGREALRRLLEIDPQAKVIASSGYTNDPVMSDYGSHGFKGVIPKPYRLGELGRALRQVFGKDER